MELDEILADRGKTYGSFATNAAISRTLKRVIYSHQRTAIPDVHLEAIDMICLKLSRILSGAHNHADSWDDIAGYAKLVADHVRS